MKRLVVAGGGSEEGAEVCPGASTSDNEFNIVTVSSDNIVTLATSVVAQLTGQASAIRLRLKKMAQIKSMNFLNILCLFAVLPVTGSVTADETEALKAEITKAVEKVQEAGKAAGSSRHDMNTRTMLHH